MNRIAVIDTETTGMGVSDEVVEFAAVLVPTKEQVAFHSLVKPKTAKIGIEAMSVHHITEEMVEDMPDIEDVYQHTPLMGCDYIAAHNAEFDRQYLPMMKDRKWICTWRCANHIWPEAPGHSNQVLRYWLGVKLPDYITTEFAPHRAVYDAWTTALILERMLESRTPEVLLALTTTPIVLRTVRFGKHKGDLWKDVPIGYLQWILKQADMDADVKYTATYYMRMARR